MVSTLIASAGLFACQQTVQLEDSVVAHLDGEQWVFDLPSQCPAPTLLSPDLSPVVKRASPAPEPSLSNSPSSGSPFAATPPVTVYQCKPTYQVRTIQITVSSEGLAPAERAKLAELAAQGITHVQFARYVGGDGDPHRPGEATGEDVTLVRTALERLLPSAVSMSEETKRVDGEAASGRRGRIVGVAAVIVKPCGERVRPSSSVRPPLPVTGPSSEVKGGEHGVAPR